ncbi:MAG: serine/threonine-protein phosphatase [Kineosporiaceae bacterium]|nr:serine/threonine-protein phosphatase [Kineosporiaceae bacterium]
MAIALRYAARSDVGLVRANNQDSAYAGPNLLVVADGMGGHAGGDVASSLAIGEMAPLDDESHGADALEHLSEAVHAAHRELLDRVDLEPALAGMGTTVTALLRSGSRLALAHIGDSRAYLLREGALVQITKDHTFVQTLVDEGRITAAEAEHHPQRSVVMRVVSDVVDDVEPDLSMREARIGDRYLLCSDGLSGVVSLETMQQTMAALQDPVTTCENLVHLALRAGAPDNVTCIVADIVEDTARDDLSPCVVGAASLHQPRRGLPGRRGRESSAAERAAALTAVGDGDEEDSQVPSPSPDRRRVIGGSLLVVLLLIGGGFGAWRWVAAQIFVGDSDGTVAVFNGLPQDLGPVSLSRLRSVADVQLVDLPDYARTRIVEGIPADDQAGADAIVTRYRELAARCLALRAASSATLTPGPSPSGALTPTATVTATVTVTPAATGTQGTPADPSGSASTVIGSAVASGPVASGSAAPSVSPTSDPLSPAATPPATPEAGLTPTPIPTPIPSDLDCGDLTPATLSASGS